jgi:hypothetical protein
MRRAARSVRPAAVAGLVLAALGASACGSDYARQGESSSYMIINVLEAQGVTGTGSGSGTFTPVLRSDVQTKGSVFEDNGRVTMTAAMHDASFNAASPTTNNLITVNRYRVEFHRSDNRNTPGVDVPYAFDGAVTFTVAPGSSVSVPFSLVRAQAKLEAPLMNLRRRDLLRPRPGRSRDQCHRSDQRELCRLGRPELVAPRRDRNQFCAG